MLRLAAVALGILVTNPPWRQTHLGRIERLSLNRARGDGMACLCCQAGEAALSLHSRAAARLPLLLHCLLLQASAAGALTQCHFVAAGGLVSEMKHLLAAFPTLLHKPLQSACHTLCGSCTALTSLISNHTL